LHHVPQVSRGNQPPEVVLAAGGGGDLAQARLLLVGEHVRAPDLALKLLHQGGVTRARVRAGLAVLYHATAHVDPTTNPAIHTVLRLQGRAAAGASHQQLSDRRLGHRPRLPASRVDLALGKECARGPGNCAAKKELALREKLSRWDY